MSGVVLQCGQESFVEDLGIDRIIRGLKILDSAGQHAVAHHLRNLLTSLTGLGLGVVFSLHEEFETLDEIIDVGLVEIELLLQERHQSVGHRHTGGIAQRIAGRHQADRSGSLNHSLHLFLLVLLSGSCRYERGTHHEGECQYYISFHAKITSRYLRVRF